MVSHVSIRKGDTGCVLVGGRVSGKPAPQDSFTRSAEGATHTHQPTAFHSVHFLWFVFSSELEEVAR